MKLPEKDIARFNEKFTVGALGCHIWADQLDRDGYGTFYLMGKPRRAHRVAWLIHRGVIPSRMLVGHNCRNRACVNPQHLRLVTPLQNTLENSSSIPALNAQKTHCQNGHPLDRSYNSKKGRVRYCSVCQSAKQKRLRSGRTDPLKGII